MSAPPAPDDSQRRRAFAILFAVLLTSAAANTAMQSVLPAIGREIGIPDVLVVAIFSLSALFWAITSPIWARASDTRGRKPLVALGTVGFGVSMLGFALVVQAGLRHLIAPLVVFGGAMMARAIFGLVGSASFPAAQAYVADHTERTERTGAMATMASAAGLGTILGPAVAPFFVLPFVGLSGPMFAFALIAFGVLFVVSRWLPDDRAGVEPTLDGETPTLARPSARVRWRDPRIAPFIIYGFLLSSAQAINGQTLGFMIIDKLGVAPSKAQSFTGVAMMAGAGASLLAQWGLIRMLRLGPRQLLRWGAGLAALGNLIVAFAPSYGTVVAAFALCSLGYGFARPGFTAGASLAVGPEEQGAVAGAVSAINGACIIVAPVLGVGLYGWLHPSPYLLNLVLLAGLVAYALRNPSLRAVGETPPDEPEMSALD